MILTSARHASSAPSAETETEMTKKTVKLSEAQSVALQHTVIMGTVHDFPAWKDSPMRKNYVPAAQLKALEKRGLVEVGDKGVIERGGEDNIHFQRYQLTEAGKQYATERGWLPAELTPADYAAAEAMGEVAANIFGDDDSVCDYCGNSGDDKLVDGLCRICRHLGIMPVEQMLREAASEAPRVPSAAVTASAAAADDDDGFGKPSAELMAQIQKARAFADAIDAVENGDSVSELRAQLAESREREAALRAALEAIDLTDIDAVYNEEKLFDARQLIRQALNTDSQ